MAGHPGRRVDGPEGLGIRQRAVTIRIRPVCDVTDDAGFESGLCREHAVHLDSADLDIPDQARGPDELNPHLTLGERDP